MKKLIALLLVVVMMLGLVACGTKETADSTTPAEAPATPAEAPAEKPAEAPAETPAETAGDKTIRVGLDMSRFDNMDVALSTYSWVFEYSDLVFDRLFDKNPETLEIFPSLLTGMPELSEDGLTYTFELKEGVKFHDGSDLTAEDVQYTFEQFLDPETASLSSWAVDMIVGYDEFLEGTADTLAGLEVIDDYHFTITLQYPFSAFCDVLASSFLPILPSDAHAANKDVWGTKVLIGTGPMILESFEPGKSIKLTANKDYHGNVVAFDALEVTHMETSTALLEWEAGTIDVCDVTPDMVDYYRTNYPDNMQEVVFVGGEWVTFNMAKAPLDNINVRKALCYATDPSQIIEGYFGDCVSPAEAIIPSSMVGHSEDSVDYTYDIEKAKEALAEAGYPDGIEVSCTVISTDNSQPVFEILQQQWAEAGIDLKIELAEGAAWTEQRTSGNANIFIRQWFADYIDPDMFMSSVFGSSNAVHLSTGFADEWFDEQCLEGRKLDPSQKDEFYAKLDHYVCSEQFSVRPLYYSMGFTLTSDRVEGVIYKGDYEHSFVNAKIVE